MRYKDMTGQKFGRLMVVNYAGTNQHRSALWKCECECGNVVVVTGGNLRYGKTSSCGCLHRELSSKILNTFNQSDRHITNGHLIHGQAHTRLYNIWNGMKKRCNNGHYEHFDRYGGRGIRLCEEWLDFNNFYDWAASNGYSDNLTIERINVNGDYCPENCKWIPQSQQWLNRTNTIFVNYNGQRITLKRLSNILDINYKLLHAKYRAGNLQAYALGVTYLDLQKGE